jgi:hypothetical protein
VHIQKKFHFHPQVVDPTVESNAVDKSTIKESTILLGVISRVVTIYINTVLAVISTVVTIYNRNRVTDHVTDARKKINAVFGLPS